jgi:YD repeat-containing protein
MDNHTSPTVQNSIIWGNAASSGPQVYHSSGTPTYDYTLVQGQSAGGFTGSEDPAFVDARPAAEAPTTAGDYHFGATSEVIDMGDNATVPADVTTDLDGNARIQDGNDDGTATVDLGAYELAGSQFLLELPNDQLAAGQDPCNGGNCPSLEPQHHTTYPVNTRSGNFWTRVTDLAVQSPGPELTWTRTYVSHLVDEGAAGMGPGWQHPYATRLITPGMPEGEANTISVLSGAGNKLRYHDNGDGTYTAYPGVYSTLTESGGQYTQTLRDQRQYVFDATSGDVLTIRDPHGRELTLTRTTDQLRITDAQDSTRELTVTLSNGQVSSVSDGTRTVSYTYDATGNLETVTDVMGRVTRYTYTDPLHTSLLSRIALAPDPLDAQQDVLLEEMVYGQATVDSETVYRVITQTLQDGRELSFDYQDTYTDLTTWVNAQVEQIQRIHYDLASNTMIGIDVTEVANPTPSDWRQVQGSDFVNSSFSPGAISDGNGNTTTVSYTEDGLPTSVTNALNQPTVAMTYDSHNRPTVQEDVQRGTAIRWFYTDPNDPTNPDPPVEATSIITQITAITSVTDSNGDGTIQQSEVDDGFTTVSTFDSTHTERLITQQRPNGVVTWYRYNTAGQRTDTIVGWDAQAQAPLADAQ